MRENDEKNHSLNLATHEVIEVRRSIKTIQQENQILRNNLSMEESSQLENLISKEINSMSM